MFTDPDQARQYLSSLSNHPNRVGDTAYLHPDFALAMANSIQQARAQGMNVRLLSGYRDPSETGSEFDADLKSAHSYGLASDVIGIGGPGSASAQRWAQIAGSNGLHNPYGINNTAEFNHWQLPAQPLNHILDANGQPTLWNNLKNARASGDWNRIWAAYGNTGAGTAGTAGTGAAIMGPVIRPSTLTDLITQTANSIHRPDLIPILNGIRAGESLHTSNYDKKDDALESSWGPFQLNRRAGLGVQFERDTGLDLRNSNTIPQQVAWVANYLAKGGSTSPWAGYHGPRDADPNWGNSGYNPSDAPATMEAGKGGAVAGAQGYAPVTPAEMEGMSIGQALSSLAAPMSGGGGGSQPIMDAPDQPAIRTPAAMDPETRPNAVPAQFSGGGSVPSTLGQLAMQPMPGGEMDPGSITSGDGMTALMAQAGLKPLGTNPYMSNIWGQGQVASVPGTTWTKGRLA